MDITRLLLVLCGLVIPASASAVAWNTSSGSNIGLTSLIYCGETGGCTTTSGNPPPGLSGAIITLTAYSTQAVASGTTSPTDDTTQPWLAAQLGKYSGGIGISNITQAEGTTPPQHAIDNRGVNDILVVDLGPGKWDVSSISVGYTCLLDGAGTGCTSTNSGVNFDAWIGNSLDAATVANGFYLNNGSATLPGFNALTFTPDVGGPGQRNESSAYAGRFLVITGSLSGASDAFKLSGIQATRVPVPGSAPLIVLGLLALTWVSRRRATTIR